MTLKQIAILNTAKIVGLAVIVGSVTSILMNTLPLYILGISMCVMVFAFFTKMIYDLELSKAKHLESLDEIKNL